MFDSSNAMIPSVVCAAFVGVMLANVSLAILVWVIEGSMPIIRKQRLSDWAVWGSRAPAKKD